MELIVKGDQAFTPQEWEARERDRKRYAEARRREQVREAVARYRWRKARRICPGNGRPCMVLIPIDRLFCSFCAKGTP